MEKVTTGFRVLSADEVAHISGGYSEGDQFGGDGGSSGSGGGSISIIPVDGNWTIQGSLSSGSGTVTGSATFNSSFDLSGIGVSLSDEYGGVALDWINNIQTPAGPQDTFTATFTTNLGSDGTVKVIVEKLSDGTAFKVAVEFSW